MAAKTHLSRAVYDRAERLLERNISKLVFNATLEPHWLPDGSFWYRRESREGGSVVRVDAATGHKTEVSDPETLTGTIEGPPPEALCSPDGSWELLRSGHDIALREAA